MITGNSLLVGGSSMFGIGMPEFLLILVVALVVLGPKKLPELARSIGKGLAEFKKSAEELKSKINIQEDLNEIQKDITEMVDPYPYSETPESSRLPDELEGKTASTPVSETSDNSSPKVPPHV
jgi:Tat protein translocase TatB subunit